MTVVARDGPGCVSTARAYITLHGTKGSSTKTLFHGQRCIAAVGCDLGDLASVTLGHDNSGANPDWFVSKVCVTGEGREWEVMCEKWLSMDNGDGRIERILYPTLSPDNSTQFTLTVHIWTSDIRGAGTDANVTIQIHGSHDNSTVIPLGDGVTNFEAGEHDVFRDVCSSNVGDIEGITISHDGSRAFPDWHIARVAIIDNNTGHKHIAHYDRLVYSVLYIVCINVYWKYRWLKATDGKEAAKIRLPTVLQALHTTANQITENSSSNEITASGRSLTSQYESQLRAQQSSHLDTTNSK